MAVVTDQTILNEIQYDLIEAPDLGATFPSGLWTAAEVLSDLNGAQNSFVRQTRAFIGRAPFVLAPNVESVDLGAAGGWEDVYQIVHVVLELAAGTFHEIPPSGTFAADHASSSWSTAAAAQTIPLAHSSRDTPSLTIRLMPASSVGGTLWIHYITRPVQLTRFPEQLLVQSDLALGVKWGCLATLLGKVGRAQDPKRAGYAAARMREFEELTSRLLGGMD